MVLQNALLSYHVFMM